MDIDLEVFKGQEPEYHSDLEFYDVVREAAVALWGEIAQNGRILIELEATEDPVPYPGPPEVRSLPGGFGHCTLSLKREGQAMRQRFSISELLGPVLAGQLSKMDPDEDRWSFKVQRRRSHLAIIIRPSTLFGMRDHDERPAPEAEGTVEVDLRETTHRPFTLTPLAVADAESVEPETLGLRPDELGKINVLMSNEIHQRFDAGLPLSRRIEEGGFMIGRVTRAEDAHLVEITHVTPAHRSGAGMVHFTFTGESFLEIARLIEERGRDEELVGWYHTHLLGVDSRMGLSSIDVDLHLATFHKPWQLAALINLRPQGRLLRFYGRSGDGLEEYRQWISDDSGRYRPAGRSMGGD